MAVADTNHSRERTAAMAAAVEAAEDGVSVTDLHGRVLYENAALEQLLARESEVRTLEAAIVDGRCAARARAEPRADAGQTPIHSQGPSVTLSVRTAAAEYRVRATAMRGYGAVQPGMIMVVWVRRCRPRILTPKMLGDRFGLTAREVRVAALVAARAGSREIARVLGISPHTARRHAEAVLRKLGVHSRGEVRERLRE